MDYVSKKIRAFTYYLDPTSPTFGNALGSLTRAGYSYNYAKSYSREVFHMERFVDALHKNIYSHSKK